MVQRINVMITIGKRRHLILRIHVVAEPIKAFLLP